MLEVKNLFLQVGNFCIKNLNLIIEKKTCHAIIGHTGSGKTILLETIMGFRKPLKGKIYLNNKEITKTPIEKRNISYLPQDIALFPHLNVKENIFYGLKIRKEKEPKYYKLMDELIENFKINHVLERNIQNLSGGEKQRVALIRAIATGNNYLLLDEPFTGLHEGMKKELWFLIKEIQKKYNLTILMVTHNIEEAFLLGDNISIMINGMIYQSGTKEEVYQYPKTLEVAKFFGIRNLFNAKYIKSVDNKIIVYCVELNCHLSIQTPSFFYNNLSKFIIGIRSENVMILRPELIKENQDNVLEGNIIEIFNKGKSYTILFLPNNSKTYIEIEIPNYAFYKLNLYKGKTVLISLREEKIFLIT